MAWQMIQQASQSAYQVSVFFDGDGIWHAQPVGALDPGLIDLHQEYNELNQKSKGLRLLVCRAALTRRTNQSLNKAWQSSGLTELAEYIEQANHVVTFAA